MSTEISLITGKDIATDFHDEIFTSLQSAGVAFNEIKFHGAIFGEADKLYLLCLSDDEIRAFVKNQQGNRLLIGILPNPLCPRIMRSYGISGKISEAIEDALNPELQSQVDLLLCNEEPVFNNVIIGDVHGLNDNQLMPESRWQTVKRFLSNLSRISFKDYVLTTGKGQSIQTSATGIMILEHSTHGVNNNLINENLSLHDGKLNALILAPKSIISYLYYLLLVFFYHHFSMSRLPLSVGTISTAKLDISSSQSLDYVLDGNVLSATEVRLEIQSEALAIRLGRRLVAIQGKDESDFDDRELVRVHGLPRGEVSQLLVNKTLPLFAKATEEDFKELLLSMRQSAVLAMPFLILMVLSTLLATTGLFQSSAPVIIGAMILAPLMSPIISFSMGLVRADPFLLKESTWTLLVGILTALLFSCLYTYLMPLSTLTDEMRGRLHPNILDLMVALISGVAGAYANSKSEVAKSLAGVAIAVALVPPLSVTGVGLGWGNAQVIYGSFLLFVTNLVGITLAASLTFIVLGYAPIQRARKGVVLIASLLLLVTAPLLISFKMVIDQNRIIDQLGGLQVRAKADSMMHFQALSIDLSQHPAKIWLEVTSHKIPQQQDLDEIKHQVEEVIHAPVALKISTVIEIQ